MISFLQTDSKKIVDPNKLFENELAWDDRFDPNLNKPKRINLDFNNVSKISEKDLIKGKYILAQKGKKDYCLVLINQ